MLVGAGANDIGGINFMVSAASKLLDQAREQAFADARRKAEIYAKAAGVTLGAPLSISEGNASAPVFRSKMALAPMAAAPGSTGRRDAVRHGERILGHQARAVARSLTARRPGAGRDPYGAGSRFGNEADAFCNNVRQGFWVPARRSLRSLGRDDTQISTTCPGLSVAKRSRGIFASSSAAPSAVTGASIASSVSWKVP